MSAAKLWILLGFCYITIFILTVIFNNITHAVLQSEITQSFKYCFIVSLKGNINLQKNNIGSKYIKNKNDMLHISHWTSNSLNTVSFNKIRSIIQILPFGGKLLTYKKLHRAIISYNKKWYAIKFTLNVTVTKYSNFSKFRCDS